MENLLLRKLRRLTHGLLLSRYFPSRKAIATGCAGIAAYYLVLFFNATPDVAAALVAAVTTIVTYLVPQSVRDLTRTADYIITDVSGKVTDLLWKFDKAPSEKKRSVAKKEIKNVNDVANKTPAVKPESSIIRSSGPCPAGSCGCTSSQDKDSMSSTAGTQTGGDGIK